MEPGLPGRKEEAHLPSPCPKAGCAGKWVGRQIYFVTATISTAMKGLSGVVFTPKAAEQPTCHRRASWKTLCGEQAKGRGCFSPARQGYPNAWPPIPSTSLHYPSSLPIRASQPVAEGKNYLLLKNTEREKLSSGFLEILRQKNKHGS